MQRGVRLRRYKPTGMRMLVCVGMVKIMAVFMHMR